MSDPVDRPAAVPAAPARQAPWAPSEVACAHVDRLLGHAAVAGGQAALQRLLGPLLQGEPSDGHDVARLLLERGQPLLSAAVFRALMARHPDFPGVRYGFARALWQSGDSAGAEGALRRILAGGWDSDAGQLLAHVLRSQGRLNGAAEMMLARAETIAGQTEEVLKAVQFMRECQRQDLAAGFCEREMARGNRDPRLYALAGNVEQELGHFDQARVHYRDALNGGIDLNSWFVLSSLASMQRYADLEHPDVGLMRRRAHDQALSPRARAAILHALGKACDDAGDFAKAATAWREANALVRPLSPWSRQNWRDFVSSRRSTAPTPAIRGGDAGCTPIFVVGLPRSGTTLVAELLGRHPEVRNRGELPTLAYLAERLLSLPSHQRTSGLAEAAHIYLQHLRRDDAPARFYVDKNPLNFRYLDIVAALFPGARVVHCRRNARDTALSIWSQLFANDEYAFSSDLQDIAAVEAGCGELMTHWQQSLPLSITPLDYEQLAADPLATMQQLLPALGLSHFDPLERETDQPVAVTSASQWQVRQPIHRRSVERWRHYQQVLPELLQLFPG